MERLIFFFRMMFALPLPLPALAEADQETDNKVREMANETYLGH